MVVTRLPRKAANPWPAKEARRLKPRISCRSQIGADFIIATTDPFAGNQNDAYNLKAHLQAAFKSMKRLGLSFQGAFFNADKAFDTKDARKTCFHHGVIPNIVENKRNRKTTKRGRKRLFNADVYKRRFTCERTFAWVDKFMALLIGFERKDAYFLGAHFMAFAMVNLHPLVHSQVLISSFNRDF